MTPTPLHTDLKLRLTPRDRVALGFALAVWVGALLLIALSSLVR